MIGWADLRRRKVMDKVAAVATYVLGLILALIGGTALAWVFWGLLERALRIEMGG